MVEAGQRVFAVHSSQNRIAGRLQGKVNAWIELRNGGEVVEDFLREVLGVRRDKREALELRQPRDRRAEIAEVGGAPRIAPCIHRLADERDLPGASSDAIAYLVHDCALRPMIEAAADVGYDAKGTVVGATSLHGYERSQVAKGVGYPICRATERESQHVIADVILSSDARRSLSDREGPRRKLIAELR